eukprot:TRINITY_DN72211_c0_g1_i1.p1 TRINITY_DN72211_c0_g1~~TRINITY_DN72211_c0_g1_i1.p1  ORF type:complete len:526 (+),score=106.90 TRINITY_DN72211_c0_g1_i1:102-1679(+)
MADKKLAWTWTRILPGQLKLLLALAICGYLSGVQKVFTWLGLVAPPGTAAVTEDATSSRPHHRDGFDAAVLPQPSLRAPPLQLRQSPRIAERVGYPYLNVVHLGAVGDGVADSTAAFREALERVRKAGGGTIRIPAGVFRSGPLVLTSRLTLYLERGAVLQAIDDFALYSVVDPLVSYGYGREGKQRGRRAAFLFGEHLTDVVLTGDRGRIDGGGPRWWSAKQNPATWDGITLPHLVEVLHTRGLEISNLDLTNSPLWTVHPFACTDVIVRDVTILNPVSAHNTDGINPDSCENVLIENVVYTGGDDGIAIKSGWDCFGDERGFNRPTRNVLIRNFTVLDTRAAAVAVGSEMSGGVENVRIEGMRVERAGAGGALCIKTTAARAGFVRNITLIGLELGVIDGHPEQIAGVLIAGKLGGWIPEPNPACPTSRKPRLPAISDVILQRARQLPGTRIAGPALRFDGLREGQILKGIVVEDFAIRGIAQSRCSNARVTLASDVSLGESGSSAATWTRGKGCILSDSDDA